MANPPTLTVFIQKKAGARGLCRIHAVLYLIYYHRVDREREIGGRSNHQAPILSSELCNEGLFLLVLADTSGNASTQI